MKDLAFLSKFIVIGWGDIEHPDSVKFNLYRMPSGSALTEDTEPYLTFTMKEDHAEFVYTEEQPQPEDFTGSIGIYQDEHKVESNEGTYEGAQSTYWHTIISSLPRYDEAGREYEYLLLEENEDGYNYFPIYETTRDAETGDYYTKVINPPPGEGQRIMVRKADADQYKDIDSFNGKTIAVQKNTTQEKIAQNSLPGVSVTSMEKIPLAVLELTTNKADGVVIESTVAQPYLIANTDLVLCDAELPEDVRYKDTAVAVPKGNEDFLELINETIKECQDEGLIDQWIEEYSSIAAEQNAG